MNLSKFYTWWSVLVSLVLIFLFVSMVVNAIGDQKLETKHAIYGVIMLICIVVNIYTMIRRLKKRD